MTSPSRRELIVAGSVGLLAASPARAAQAVERAEEAASAPPALSLVFTARISVGAPVEQGNVDGSRRRFVPITGGSVSAAADTAPTRISGSIAPGGGDWQAIHPDGLTDIAARYTIIHDDGTAIAITNPGVRTASAEVIARLTAGEVVDPALYYFRTTPSFTVAAGPHDWLRRRVFVGRGIRMPDHVMLECYVVG